MTELVVGAVAYDAKVVPIWEGFRPVFAAEVGRLLGRQVLAVESQLVFDPDTLFLIFVLGDKRAPEPAAEAGEIADANHR